MFISNGHICRAFLYIVFIFCVIPTGFCQSNLLLNGNFKEINTCKEYHAECGVEAWFYLKDVKVQIVSNEPGTQGANSFALFYNWNGYKDFTPVIGTILPCNLQQGKQYVFKGWISARLNSQLILTLGFCIGENFYVPKRPFSKMMNPANIAQIKPVAGTSFFEFEYRFIADGNERYLTFGTFINEDSLGTKKRLFGPQTISLMPDNFSLTSTNPLETVCAAYMLNKASIYQYDYRHKDMDYTLYGKGKLPVELSGDKKENLTVVKPLASAAPKPPKPDTLKLGDVLFDFNKADLKENAIKMLEVYFKVDNKSSTIDSIYIEGHTDSVGSDTRNIMLSTQRSEAVMKWLVTNNVVASIRITIHAFGKSRPVASNKTSAGRSLNRRVEIIVFRRQDE